MKTRVRMLIPVLTAVLLAAATMTSASAGGGNSNNAKLCNQGGWKELSRADGSKFKNAGDCVSYAARGGVFGAAASMAPPSAFSAEILDYVPDNCTITVRATWKDNSSNESGFVLGPDWLPDEFPDWFTGYAMTPPNVEEVVFSYSYSGGQFPVYLWAFQESNGQTTLVPEGTAIILWPERFPSCIG